MPSVVLFNLEAVGVTGIEVFAIVVTVILMPLVDVTDSTVVFGVIVISGVWEVVSDTELGATVTLDAVGLTDRELVWLTVREG